MDADGNLVGNGSYMAAQLWVEKRSDEEGHPVYTFTDKQGRTVLSRRMKGTEAHDTYYVYDAYDRLCYVLPPMYQTEADLGKYAFQYRYNDRDLPVRKQLPGAAYVEYEYDVNDRLSFSQDGNQRTAGKWTYYLYDGLGRLTEQGECTNKSTLAGKSVLVKNYYDSYAFVGGTGFPAATFPADGTGYGKGRLTGSEVAVPGSNTKLHNAYYYDVKGRTTKTVQGNLLGGYEVTATTYTFTDLPAMVSHTHTASRKTTRTEAYTYTYDHADRLAKVEHTLGGVKVTLASYTYDDLGGLSTKSPHGSAANKLTYAYNIRGWLTGISGAKFTQDLYYNTGAGTPLYNGNISSMTWKAGTESTVRGYKFTYDLLDRMLNAVYGESASITANINRFSENVTGYDKNGNILRLTRFGQTGASVYGLIDNLTYTLTGNQLNRVDDAVTVSAYGSGFGFQEAVKQANEYAYDANGNLTKDLNKNIASISYNCLNLPSVVTFTGGSSIRYTYAADGRKLRVTHILGDVAINTDYCGNVVYEAGAQKYLLTEEGYVSLNDSQYHYYLKDHQGNNRVVISSSGTVEEVTHYYPFGGIFAKTNNVQPYKYNGKELDTKKGLNWYDYGARHYDAALGRWHTVDPLAEKYYEWASYVYCKNSPILRSDFGGKDDYIMTKNGYLVLSQPNTAKIDRVYYGSKKGNSISIADKHLLPMMLNTQKDWRGGFSSYGSTSNLSDAVKLFKFGADNTTVEWKLDVYLNNSENKFIIVTDHKEGSVNGGDWAASKTKTEGDKVIDIHSHPSMETKGASDADQELINAPNNAVYFKKDATLHEYDSNNKNKNSMSISSFGDLERYVKSKLSY